MEQDILSLLEGRKLRMVPLPENEPRKRAAPRPARRKNRVMMVVSLLLAVVTFYLLFHFVA